MAPAILQLETLAAGIQLAKVEGIIPAPEANHAVEGAIREDLRCKEKGWSETILFTYVDMVIMIYRPIPTTTPVN